MELKKTELKTQDQKPLVINEGELDLIKFVPIEGIEVERIK